MRDFGRVRGLETGAPDGAAKRATATPCASADGQGEALYHAVRGEAVHHTVQGEERAKTGAKRKHF